MGWVCTWIDGISDTWLRIFALAGVAGLFLGAIGFGLAVYQMVTGRRAVRLLKKAACHQEKMERRQEESDRCLKGIEQFLYQKFGDRAEIRAIFESPAMEGKAEVGIRKAEKDEKKPTFLLTLRKLLGKLFP